MFNEHLRELAKNGIPDSKLIGREIRFYNSLSSTQKKAKELTEEVDFEGLVVLAAEQTEGVGRLDRKWLSPEGNVYMSVLLKPDIKQLPYLIMLASVAVVKAIDKITRIKAKLKWPNDVLIGGKKVCGIMVETEIKGKKVDYSSIGIGIDVRLNVDKHPEISEIATSLQSELGENINPSDMVEAVLTELDKLYLILQKTPEELHGKWRKLMGMLGEEVSVTCGGDIYLGIAEDVLEDGSLMLKLSESGDMKKIVYGDVTRCRV